MAQLKAPLGTTVKQTVLRKLMPIAYPRRRRFCPRALRQPVSSWLRLSKSAFRQEPVEYSVGKIYA